MRSAKSVTTEFEGCDLGDVCDNDGASATVGECVTPVCATHVDCSSPPYCYEGGRVQAACVVCDDPVVGAGASTC